MIKQLANLITGMRMAFSIVLLFLNTLSPSFIFLYITAGVSDAADGMIARKTGTVSDFGSKLDSAADLVLVAVCMIKIIPVIDIPVRLIIWIIAIAVIKAVNLISGYVMRKEFCALHTVMNKATGVSLFILPLTLKFFELKYSGSAVCAVATFAAIQEGHLIRTAESEKIKKSKIFEIV